MPFHYKNTLQRCQVLNREPQGWRVNLANKQPIGNSRKKHSKITNKRSLTRIRKVSNHLYNESKYHKISQSSIALNKGWSLESCNSLLIQNKNMQKKKKKNNNLGWSIKW